MQEGVDKLVKDGQNTSDKYSYVSSEMVLDTLRPKMNELKLLLMPIVTNANLSEGQTKSGTTRYMTEMHLTFVWVDCETGERLEVPFYAQGVDLAGEKGVGKALTYAEKYFFLKFFHIGTSKDDPDNDGKTGKGEKSQKGTQAAKETADYCRKAVSQMVNELCGGDDEKVKQTLILFTKNDSRQYAGVDSVDKVTDAAVQVLYAKIKKTYEKKTGKAFAMVAADEE
jgi:hypothetical protein